MKVVSLAVVALVTCAAAARADTLFSAAGALPADIQATIDAYRSAIPGPNNGGVAGSQGMGRREINWDGVPDAFSSPNAFPGNFFNVNSTRGVVFSTSAGGFEVSADSSNPTVTPVRFGHINPAYTAQFTTFSAERLFSPTASNVTEVRFFIPGTSTPATTLGFGTVFCDVDVGNVTSIQYFRADNSLAATHFASVFDNGLTFLGLVRDTPDIAFVRITTGSTALNVVGGSDYVVMDDFIYAEPIPAPGAAAILLSVAIAGRRRR